MDATPAAAARGGRANSAHDQKCTLGILNSTAPHPPPPARPPIPPLTDRPSSPPLLLPAVPTAHRFPLAPPLLAPRVLSPFFFIYFSFSKLTILYTSVPANLVAPPQIPRQSVRAFIFCVRHVVAAAIYVQGDCIVECPRRFSSRAARKRSRGSPTLFLRRRRRNNDR